MPNGDSDRMAGWLQQARIRRELEDWPNCLAAAEAVLRHDSGNAEAEILSAVANFAMNHPEKAAGSISRVIALLPDDGGLHLFHARCLLAQDKSGEALPSALKAAEHLPDSVEAQYACGVSLKRTGQFGRAIPYLERALALAPERYRAWNDLGDIFIARGELQEALKCFRQSHAIAPYNTDAMSALCFYGAFDPETDAAALFAIRRGLGRHLERQAGDPVRPSPAAPRTDGRLRVGYLAYDMGNEVTSWFLEPVLARHDRTRFHITGYHGNPRKDDYTRRLAVHADSWHDVAGESPEATAARIRADGIDILVLASFYNGKDHRVFAHRPAPIQVGYLNRVASSGLHSVDYIISEAISDPPGKDDNLYTEALVRLTDHAVYLPTADAPEPRLPPCLANGYVTFGSFNNHAKIGPAVIETWSGILHAIPDSRLILRSSAYFGDPETCRIFRRQFEVQGIDATRLDFQGIRRTRRDHLEGMSEADIALDPFPCNGGTTTCEAFWMGLPLVTMVTDRFMGRQGLRYLTKLGLRDLAATTAEEYIAAACHLAGNSDRLIQLRHSLRGRFEREMMDYPRHAREMEAAYSHMWQCLGAGVAPGPFDVHDGTVTTAAVAP